MVSKLNYNYNSKTANSQSGLFGTINVKYGDVVGITVYANAQSTAGAASASSFIMIDVTQVSGCFCQGTYPYLTGLVAQTCSTVTLPPGTPEL